MNPNRLSTWADGMNKMGRPFLTVLVTVFYNAVLLIAVCIGQLKINDYILAVGPVNAMVMGFWFGERKQINDPGQQPDGSK